MLRLSSFFKEENLNKEIDFPKKTVINCQEYSINVVFSKKKNSSVALKNDQLIFRLSTYLRKSQIMSHFDSLLFNITKKIEKLDLKVKSIKFEDFIDQGYFYFNSKKFFLEKTNKIKSIKFSNDVFYYGLEYDFKLLEKNIVRKLINLYEKELYDYVLDLNRNTFNYNIKGFKLKCVESKWGHCTHKDEIMLNLKLLNAKREVLDYVIIHELAHIKQKNHSAQFWGDVSIYCPNYKKLRFDLKRNSPTLFVKNG